MYKATLIFLTLLSFKAFSQQSQPNESVTFTSNYNIGMVYGIHRKVFFTIFIKDTAIKVNLTNKEGEVLYTQIDPIGNFVIETQDTPVQINFFIDKNGQQITSYLQSFPVDTTVFNFGNDKVEIKVTSVILTDKYDLKNKHFVRFMCFSSLIGLDQDFAISIEKLLPPDHYTEPEWNEIESNEVSQIVTDDVYSKFKNYIQNYSPHLSTDRNVRLRSNFTMEIDIDYKDRYFLSNRETIAFLKDFVIYLEKNHLNNHYTSTFLSFISDAKYALANEGKQPKEPN